jgi:hypothetical protein
MRSPRMIRAAIQTSWQAPLLEDESRCPRIYSASVSPLGNIDRMLESAIA